MGTELRGNNSPGDNRQTDPLQPWQVINSREVYVAKPWITVLQQEVRLPNGQVIKDYHHIAMGEFVIVFAQTAGGKVIIERQYKHGLGKVSLMLPAGSIEAGEDPLTAVQRELLEETGYRSDRWESLGDFVPNGNYGCGRAHLYMATDAYKVAEPNSGDLEEMEILLMPLRELTDTMRKGGIHLLSSAALISLAQLRLSDGQGAALRT